MKGKFIQDTPPVLPEQPTRLLDQVRALIRSQNKSWATEKTYIHWIKRYILFHKKRHPIDMGEREIEAYLTHLAVQERVSPSTQATALNAIVFLYKQFLKVELQALDFDYTKQKRRLPVVFTPEEVKQVISILQGDQQIMASLMYGSGLRVSECLRLRGAVVMAGVRMRPPSR